MGRRNGQQTAVELYGASVCFLELCAQNQTEQNVEGFRARAGVRKP